MPEALPCSRTHCRKNDPKPVGELNNATRTVSSSSEAEVGDGKEAPMRFRFRRRGAPFSVVRKHEKIPTRGGGVGDTGTDEFLALLRDPHAPMSSPEGCETTRGRGRGSEAGRDSYGRAGPAAVASPGRRERQPRGAEGALRGPLAGPPGASSSRQAKSEGWRRGQASPATAAETAASRRKTTSCSSPTGCT